MNLDVPICSLNSTDFFNRPFTLTSIYRTHIHKMNLHFLHCLPQRQSLLVFLYNRSSVCLSALSGPMFITSECVALVVCLGILRSRGTGPRCSKGLRDIVINGIPTVMRNLCKWSCCLRWSFSVLFSCVFLVCFYHFNCSVFCCSNPLCILRIVRYFIGQVFVLSAMRINLLRFFKTANDSSIEVMACLDLSHFLYFRAEFSVIQVFLDSWQFVIHISFE